MAVGIEDCHYNVRLGLFSLSRLLQIAGSSRITRVFISLPAILCSFYLGGAHLPPLCLSDSLYPLSWLLAPDLRGPLSCSPARLPGCDCPRLSSYTRGVPAQHWGASRGPSHVSLQEAQGKSHQESSESQTGVSPELISRSRDAVSSPACSWDLKRNTFLWGGVTRARGGEVVVSVGHVLKPHSRYSAPVLPLN